MIFSIQILFITDKVMFRSYRWKQEINSIMLLAFSRQSIFFEHFYTHLLYHNRSNKFTSLLRCYVPSFWMSGFCLREKSLLLASATTNSSTPGCTNIGMSASLKLQLQNMTKIHSLSLKADPCVDSRERFFFSPPLTLVSEDSASKYSCSAHGNPTALL